jgi:outer membrane protein OmpA-like peptidoglycan-associated protein
MAMVAPTLAQPNETREYQDGKRRTVLLPQGDKSFADAVVDRSASTGTIEDSACDQQAILGPPDFSRSVKVEGMTLSISEDGETWIDLGDISGGRAEVDLAGLVPSDASYRLVSLIDDGDGCGTRFAGADVDAVAAIGSTLRFVILFAVDSTKLRPEAQDALDALAQNIADAGLSEFRVVGHTDSTGDDTYTLPFHEIAP